MSSQTTTVAELLNAAQNYFDQQNYKYCLKILLQITIQYEFNPHVYYSLALCYFQLNNHFLTQKILQVAVNQKATCLNTSTIIWRSIYELYVVSLFNTRDYLSLQVLLPDLFKIDQFNAIGNVAFYELLLAEMMVQQKHINYFNQLLPKIETSPYYFHVLYQKARICHWLQSGEYKDLYVEIYNKSKDILLKNLIKNSAMLDGSCYTNKQKALLDLVQGKVETDKSEILARDFKQVVNAQKWFYRVCCFIDPFTKIACCTRVELETILNQILENYNYIYSNTSLTILEKQTQLVEAIINKTDMLIIQHQQFLCKIFYNLSVFLENSQLAFISYLLGGGDKQLTQVNSNNIMPLVLYLKFSLDYGKLNEIYFHCLLCQNFSRYQHNFVLQTVLYCGIKHQKASYFELLSLIFKKYSLQDLFKKLDGQSLHWVYYLSNKQDREVRHFIEKLLQTSTSQDNLYSLTSLKCLVHSHKVISLHQQLVSLSLDNSSLKREDRDKEILKLLTQQLKTYIEDGYKDLQDLLVVANLPKGIIINSLICLIQYMIVQPSFFSTQQLSSARALYDYVAMQVPLEFKIFFEQSFGVIYMKKQDYKAAIRFLERVQDLLNEMPIQDKQVAARNALLLCKILTTGGVKENLFEMFPYALDLLSNHLEYPLVKYQIALLIQKLATYLNNRLVDYQNILILMKNKDNSQLTSQMQQLDEYNKQILYISKFSYVLKTYQETELIEEPWLAYQSRATELYLHTNAGQRAYADRSCWDVLLNYSIKIDSSVSIEKIVKEFEAARREK